jgi:hypothetical protein
LKKTGAIVVDPGPMPKSFARICFERIHPRQSWRAARKLPADVIFEDP